MIRTLLFTVLFAAMSGAATWAGATGFGADSSLHQQVGLRSAGGRIYMGGGLRGGK